MENEKLVPKLRFAEFNETWEKHNLIDVINEFYNGQTPSRSNLSYWNGNIPWTSVSDLNYGFITDTLEKITTSGKESANLKILPKNTFIIAIVGLEAKGTRGSCALLGVDSTINQACVALIPNKNKLNHHFMVQWYLNVGDKYGIKYTQGTKQQNYNIDLLKKLPIIIPSNMQEQNKIGLFLFKVDEKIRLLKEKMEVYISFKKYLMQQIFAQKLRFKTDNGKDYGDWEHLKLKDVISLNGGYAFKSELFKNEGIPIIRISNISSESNSVNLDDLVYYDKLDNDSDFIIKKGELIIAMSGATTGKVAVYDFEQNSYVNQRVGLFKKVSDNLYYPFLVQYTLSDSFKRELQKTLVAGAQPNISKKEIESFNIDLPTFEEQEKIANLLSDLDLKINTIKNQIKDISVFKKALLQQMFV